MAHPRFHTSLAALAFPLAACSSGTQNQAAGTAGTGAATGTGGTTGTTGMGGTVGTGGAAQCNGSGATGYNPYKYAYYGDLHLHTSYSLDAYSFGTRSDPKNAYLWAKGQGVVHVGSGSNALPGPDIMQARPIDFLAVTDHSEWLFVTHGCTIDMNSGYYNTSDCGLVQSPKVVDEDTVFAGLGTFKNKLCATNQAACDAQEKTAWQELQAAAASAYAPCQFTSLVAYEWTDSQSGMTNHRNVIFGSDKVPAAPLSSVDYPKPPDLWTGLDSQCTAASGCDVVTLPHNTDLSNGVSLVVWSPTPAGVAQQQKYQISAEIYQHKAGSECYYSPAEGYDDTDCQFEYPDTTKQPVTALSFVREGLASGLGYAAQNTAQGNPLKLGIVGATDDHNGAPGNVDEAKYVGHAGRLDDLPVKRLQGLPQNGSGGLTGAWAEQNTRESIFAAIKRRETFATSGPRISARFYQTTDAMACADPAFPKKIVDAHTGLPMGSTIGKAALGGAAGPTFALSVWPDAVPQDLADGTNAVAGIAKVQVIKVHAKLVNGKPMVVEDPPYLVSGVPATGGCATWTDPSFDATEYALYYVRALQVPTWRWSHYSCATLKQNNPTTWQTLVPGCVQGGGLDVSIQERAWTSPIWFEPG
jgi:hypothetical protein